VVLILIVEDEFLIRELLAETMEDAGFTVVTAANGEDAIALLEGGSFDAIATDIRLSADGVGGWEVARQARSRNADIPVVYMTGDNAHRYEANGVPNSLMFTKPVDQTQLVSSHKKLTASQATTPLSARHSDFNAEFVAQQAWGLGVLRAWPETRGAFVRAYGLGSCRAR
jgi:CheY-like chemotaxis protein